jgi:hypothetical protein
LPALVFLHLFGGGLVPDIIVHLIPWARLIVDIGPRTNTQVIVGEVDPDGTVHGVIQNAHGDVVGTVDNFDAGNLQGLDDQKRT